MAFSFREIFKNQTNELSDESRGLSFIRSDEDKAEAICDQEIAKSDEFSPFELVEVKEEQNYSNPSENQFENINFSNKSEIGLEVDNEDHFIESGFLLDEDEDFSDSDSRRRLLPQDELKVRPLEDLVPLPKRTEPLKNVGLSFQDIEQRFLSSEENVQSFLKLVSDLDEIKESLMLFPKGKDQVRSSLENNENYFSDLTINQIKDLVSIMDAKTDPLSRIDCLKHSLIFIHLSAGVLVLLTEPEESYNDVENKVRLLLKKIGHGSLF
jgi:hypothetical protein